MSAKSKHAPLEGALHPGLLFAIRFLVAGAIVVAGYLAWVSLSGSSAVGCGPDSNCDKVLHSRWGYWLGIPVSVLALLFYVALFITTFRLGSKVPAAEQRKAWKLLIHLAVALLGAAIWFVGLQFIAIKSLCPFCMSAHGIGVVVGVILLFNAPFRNPPEKPWQQEKQIYVPPGLVQKLVLPAFGGLAVLVAGQLLFTKKSFTTQPAPFNTVHTANTNTPKLLSTAATQSLAKVTIPPATQTAASVVTQAVPPVVTPPLTTIAPTQLLSGSKRLFQIYGGRFQFDIDEVPLIGKPEAPNKMVSLFDYTCHHCRLMHGHLMEVHKALGDKLSIISLPMPLDSQCNYTVRRTPRAHTNACEYARLGLAVWRANRSLHAQYDDWIFAPTSPPPLAEARAYAAQLVGPGALDKSLQDNWVNEQLKRGIDIYATNYLHVGNGSMPQLIIGTNLTSGTLSGVGDLFQILKQQFGLQPSP